MSVHRPLPRSRVHIAAGVIAVCGGPAPLLALGWALHGLALFSVCALSDRPQRVRPRGQPLGVCALSDRPEEVRPIVQPLGGGVS